MAVTKVQTGKSLKMLMNYGTVDGKVVTKNKSWAQIAITATDDKIVAVANQIDTIMAPTMEGTYVVDTNQLIEG